MQNGTHALLLSYAAAAAGAEAQGEKNRRFAHSKTAMLTWSVDSRYQ